MLNREIYLTDPASRKLVNEGVASVNDERTSQAMAVLRYELETFVCDGQYEKGLAHILETYLKNINQAQQPAVWVSGFYGSGKSHLVKMLRALWLDTAFTDGATARGIACLPQNIKDLLKELSTEAKRHGGLHAASGTLGSGSDGSVRLSLLQIIFKSVGLPESYPVAKFVLWLKHEGILDTVRNDVIVHGGDWQEELDNFYVAEGLHSAMVRAKPQLFSSTASCVETLNNLYPFVHDVSSDDMVRTIRQALTREGKFPLTAVVLDEVQQYIGDSSQRSLDVQEAVEACCKNIGGKLLFIGTGQTAITGTSNLKKLEARYTIRVELSDADVDTVIRKVILAKKVEAIATIDQVMQTNLGEVSRHLAGTTIGHRQDDLTTFPQDYPILPVRRRFWENTLRVLDQTGTDSQLRNQLGLVHKVIQTNLDAPLGSVIPADYLYFDSADKLLQSRLLPRKVHERTITWRNGAPDERLVARACGLVFLINRLGGNNKEIGIRCTVDTLADLLVEDLAQGSAALRSTLPALLDKCELLMKVGEEYRIQTEESTAWNDEFLSQRGSLANEAHRIEAERDDRIRRLIQERLKKVTLAQGAAKVSRDVQIVFSAQPPGDQAGKIHVWVRDGWSTDENSVRVDARQAGNQSPTVFVYFPKRSADDLRRYLADYKAAKSTLEIRGVPVSPEGIEARAAMETTLQAAERKIQDLLEELLSGARVFQGGGAEIYGNDLAQQVQEAAMNSLQRLYPRFPAADHAGWAKAYERAQRGAPDALKAVDDDGEPGNNPVCKAVLAFLGGGKKGADIRLHFEGPGYGWSRDAVDGSLQVLLLAGLVRALDEHGHVFDPKELERKAIGKAVFKVESTTISTAQRIKVRLILQKMGCQGKQGEELALMQKFLEKMDELANQAGGEPPQPERPDTAFLAGIRLGAGNEQLLAVYNLSDDIIKSIDCWRARAERIAQRWPAWTALKRLAGHAQGIADADVLLVQVQHIEQKRQLLEEPDPVAPLSAGLTQVLRNELNDVKDHWDELWARGEARLASDENWGKLEPEQRYDLRKPHGLVEEKVPRIAVESPEAVLRTLDAHPLAGLKDRLAAMTGRFDQLILAAARLLEPKVRKAQIPAATLRTEKDVEAWLVKTAVELKAQIRNGPVMI